MDRIISWFVPMVQILPFQRKMELFIINKNNKPIFIDYNRLKDFYTIGESCALLGMEKGDMKTKCQELDVTPTWNENDEPGFTRNDFRKLHNAVYHEKHTGRPPAPKKADNRDPWA